MGTKSPGTRGHSAAGISCPPPPERRALAGRGKRRLTWPTLRVSTAQRRSSTERIPDLPDLPLIDDDALRPELPDDHAEAVAFLHQPALARERHPAGLAVLGRPGLAPWPDLLALRA